MCAMLSILAGLLGFNFDGCLLALLNSSVCAWALRQVELSANASSTLLHAALPFTAETLIAHNTHSARKSGNTRQYNGGMQFHVRMQW